MELSRHVAPSRPSSVGLGFVVAVHVLVFWALSAAWVTPKVKPKPETTFRPLVEPQPPVREPEPRVKLDRPTVREVPVPTIDPPLLPPEPSTVQTTVTNEVRTVPSVPGIAGDLMPTVPQQPPVMARNTPVPPGAICTVMPKPEVPAVSWSGEALMHVSATVRAGRVVSSELQFTRSGLDSRTRRALQHSVETALAGYQCPGDHVFEQDFAFKLE